MAARRGAWEGEVPDARDATTRRRPTGGPRSSLEDLTVSPDHPLRSPASHPGSRSVPPLLALALLIAPAAQSAAATGPTAPLAERVTTRALGHPVAAPGRADALGGHPAAAAWGRFRQAHDLGPQAADRAFFDLRTAKPEIVELSVPWIPGAGNDLTADDVPGYDGDPGTTLAILEARARVLIDAHPDLFGIDSSELVLNRRASQGVGRLPREAGGTVYRLWHLVFDWAPHGLVVEDARAIFRVNHGNLVHLGMENVGSSFDVPTADPSALSDAETRAALAAHVGGFSASDLFLADGELAVIVTTPETVVGSGPPLYRGAVGRGLDYRLVRRYLFERPGVSEVWEGVVDAQTGEVVAFRGTSVPGVVDGKVRLNGDLTSEVTRNFPYADHQQNPSAFADSNGFFTSVPPYLSHLKGRHVEIEDDCGLIDVDGQVDVHFGGAANPSSTDCNSVEGANDGNTSAARTAYYWINAGFKRAKSFMALDWSADPLVVRTNELNQCTAHYLSTEHALEFARDSANCNNSGENVTHVLHELGHAIDFTDGTVPSDHASGEAYGDIVAFLTVRDSCNGRASDYTFGCGFGSNYTCTACNGFREADWRLHDGMTPHTPETNKECPPCVGNCSGPTPCGRQQHCEMAPAVEAVWDLVQELIDRGYSENDAFDLVEELFYSSRPSADSMFTCAFYDTTREGGATSGSLYHSLRSFDDCDGNPANGTPHAEAIFAALDRHEIAVGEVFDLANQDNDCSDPSFIVDSTGDGSDANPNDGLCFVAGGDCTLRAAIQQSNATAGQDKIKFALPGGNTIQPTSALPAITDPVIIDGFSQWPQGRVEIDGSAAGGSSLYGLRITAGGSEVKGLIINRFSGPGIRIDGAGGNWLYANRIGTDQAGQSALGNGLAGIQINGSPDNQIGAFGAGGGNLLSGNLWGLRLSGANSTGNLVFGNLIGTDLSGTGPLGNGAHGIRIDSGASGNTISDGVPHNVVDPDAVGNTIAYNGQDGIAIFGDNSTQNVIYGNRIFANGGLGIDLGNDGVTPNDPGDVDTGPNSLQNFPVITDVEVNATSTTVSGSLDWSQSSLSLFQIDVFVGSTCDPSLHGEGESHLKPYTAFNPQFDGSWTITFPVALGTGQQVTATATKSGSTSEFSECFVVPSEPTQPPPSK